MENALVPIVIHHPKTAEGIRILEQRLAETYAEYILEKIHALDCPMSQKLELLQAVIDSDAENQ